MLRRFVGFIRRIGRRAPIDNHDQEEIPLGEVLEAIYELAELGRLDPAMTPIVLAHKARCERVKEESE
jgi:hypothetical protein